MCFFDTRQLERLMLVLETWFENEVWIVVVIWDKMLFFELCGMSNLNRYLRPKARIYLMTLISLNLLKFCNGF